MSTQEERLPDDVRRLIDLADAAPAPDAIFEARVWSRLEATLGLPPSSGGGESGGAGGDDAGGASVGGAGVDGTAASDVDSDGDAAPDAAGAESEMAEVGATGAGDHVALHASTSTSLGAGAVFAGLKPAILALTFLAGAGSGAGVMAVLGGAEGPVARPPADAELASAETTSTDGVRSNDAVEERSRGPSGVSAVGPASGELRAPRSEGTRVARGGEDPSAGARRSSPFGHGGSEVRGSPFIASRGEEGPPRVYEGDDDADRRVRSVDGPSGDPGASAIEPPGTRAPDASLLEQARIALARGRPAAALQALERHAAEDPADRWREEREVLAIQALVSLGRGEEARRRATQFVRRYPESLFRPVVERAVRAVGAGELPEAFAPAGGADVSGTSP